MDVKEPNQEASSETNCDPDARLHACNPDFRKKAKAKVFLEEEGGREESREVSKLKNSAWKHTSTII